MLKARPFYISPSVFVSFFVCLFDCLFKKPTLILHCTYTFSTVAAAFQIDECKHSTGNVCLQTFTVDGIFRFYVNQWLSLDSQYHTIIGVWRPFVCSITPDVVLGTKHGREGLVGSSPRASEVTQCPRAEGTRALGDFLEIVMA